MKSKRAQAAGEAPPPANEDTATAGSPQKKRKRSDEEGNSHAAIQDETLVKKSKKNKTKDDRDGGSSDKKDKKDKKKKKHDKETRREKKDKRRDLQDLPEPEDETMAEAETAPAAVDSEAAAKKEKKKEKKDKKKSKKSKDSDDNDTAHVNGTAETPAEPEAKKSKKAKKNKKPAADDPNNANNEPIANGNGGDAANDDGEGSKQDRHIVFVGNLPFTATAETIKAHFSSLSPISVRCLTNKNDDKPCRGIAFVEFGKVWHMRTCLDKFHHSMFNDGVSPPRKINVELTAGGGGKTKQRQQKIAEKNIKLDENRAKRIEREKTAKETSAASNVEDSVHPSRRARVPGNSW